MIKSLLYFFVSHHRFVQSNMQEELVAKGKKMLEIDQYRKNEDDERT
jgi:hypothetical protein